MKFGLRFHQYKVPEWDQYYINYNAIKRLIKANDIPGLQLSSRYRPIQALTR